MWNVKKLMYLTPATHDSDLCEIEYLWLVEN